MKHYAEIDQQPKNGTDELLSQVWKWTNMLIPWPQNG
jgi:hypothetical protein